MAKKKALLIGINRYLIPGADLRGCVNDVEDMHELLTETFDFPRANVKKLLDTRAKKAPIQTEIKKLLDNAQAGDVLLLHYSGHGSNVPDSEGDEADGRDEILCPTDLNWRDTLTDDWLRMTFANVPPGVNFTVIMDCCHSGTITRAVQPPDAAVIPRFLPCPRDLMAVESGRALRGRSRNSRRRSRTIRDVSTVASMHEVLLTGCRDDQTSADARIRGDFRGAMTYSLTRAVRAKRGRLTYRELHAEMKKYLRGKYTQVPQLAGRTKNLDRPFLAPIDR